MEYFLHSVSTISHTPGFSPTSLAAPLSLLCWILLLFPTTKSWNLSTSFPTRAQSLNLFNFLSILTLLGYLIWSHSFKIATFKCMSLAQIFPLNLKFMYINAYLIISSWKSARYWMSSRYLKLSIKNWTFSYSSKPAPSLMFPIGKQP